MTDAFEAAPTHRPDLAPMTMTAEDFGGTPYGPSKIPLVVFDGTPSNRGPLALVAAYGHQLHMSFSIAANAMQNSDTQAWPRQEQVAPGVVRHGHAVVVPVPDGDNDEWTIRARAVEDEPGAFPITYTYLPTDPEPEKPRVVCLCGSTRYPDAFKRATIAETLAGRIVLSIGVNLRHDGHLLDGVDAQAVKPGLDVLHKAKIDLADEILVLNVGGYIGDSTRSEIEHATAHGKPVRYLEPAIEGELVELHIRRHPEAAGTDPAGIAPARVTLDDGES